MNLRICPGWLERPSDRRCRSGINRIGRSSLLVVAVLTLAACAGDRGVLSPTGIVAERQLAHLQSILLWMLPVVVPIFVALPLVLWRNRLGGPGRYTPKWEFSWGLEVFVWGVPAIVVSVLSWNLWTETIDLDPYKPAGSGAVLQVDAIALDWKWLFVYPALGVATADRLVLPADRPVQFRLTSGTVLQSFAIPRIGGQIYAMPGMVTEYNLHTGAPGQARGLNMQYNGENFADQSFAVQTMDPAAFDAWLEETRGAPPLDASAIARLSARDTLERPLAFGAVTGDPLDGVVRAVMHGHAMAPGVGQ